MNTTLIRPDQKRSAPSRTSVKTPVASAPPPNEILPRRENVLDAARCHQMIAEAAYFYAEHRGFQPGHELDDWLAAQNQIDAALTLEDTRRVYGDP